MFQNSFLETIPIFFDRSKSVNFSVNFIAFFECETLTIFTLKCTLIVEVFRERITPENWTFYRDNKISIICKFIDFL